MPNLGSSTGAPPPSRALRATSRVGDRAAAARPCAAANVSFCLDSVGWKHGATAHARGATGSTRGPPPSLCHAATCHPRAKGRGMPGRGHKNARAAADVWKKKDLGAFSGQFSATLESHDTMLLRISPSASRE